ncbi:MAG: ferritin family protein [Deltaproteobacteria bacterium]|nr:ferritin family protein [Deltaproteobacteria bacterium]
MIDIIKELNIAYNTEITGYFFYSTAAVMVGDDRGKNIFTHLAKEELDHIRVIGRIADSVKGGGGWISYEDALKEDTPSKRGLPIFHAENELIKRLEKNQTDLNAVTIAIENEESAVDFYSRLLKDAVKPVEKVVLTRLLEMEKGHLKILRWESESLLKTGFWCGEMEYTVEKETE